MNNKIVEYVELFFLDIPYSKDSFNAKEKIISKLTEEYGDDISIEKLAKKYNSLNKLAELVDYTKDDVKQWNKKKNLVNKDDIKLDFKRERKFSYGIIILLIITLVYLYNIIVSFRSIYVILTLIFGFIMINRWLKHKKKIINRDEYTLDGHQYLQKLHDKYSKKLTNSIFIGTTLLCFFILSIIQLKINSKSSEIIELVNINISYIEIIILLIGKNYLLTNYIDKRLKSNRTKLFKSNLKRVVMFSTIYWIIGLIIPCIITKNMINIYIIETIIYMLICIIYNLKFRKQVTYNNIVVNKKRLALASIFILLLGTYGFMRKEVWLIQPYINSVPNINESNNKIEYNDDNGIYTITKTQDDFKILQLTDIHLGGSITSYYKDMKALQAVYKLIDYTKPDFVVVTGDLTFPMGIMSFSFDNYTPVMQFASFMRNLGIPWAFTYGNHDTEAIATTSREDLNSLYMSLSYKTSKNLLYPYTQPDIMGRNNQLIEVRNSDGSLNQALFLIDSNAYTGEGINKYDFIHDDQVDWYKENILRLEKEEGKDVSSLVFFHIPLQQYKTAYELYEQGSDEVIYYFGSNDEKMLDKVCASEYPSKMFDVALELGSTKGFFCGHDHYNNMSLEYKGIRLTYGMSIDYLAMPGIEKDTKQRGATLITTHKDSTIDIEQIPLTEIEMYYK